MDGRSRISQVTLALQSRREQGRVVWYAKEASGETKVFVTNH